MTTTHTTELAERLKAKLADMQVSSTSRAIFHAQDTPLPTDGEPDNSTLTVIHKTEQSGAQGLILGISDVPSNGDDGQMVRLSDEQAFDLATSILEALS